MTPPASDSPNLSQHRDSVRPISWFYLAITILASCVTLAQNTPPDPDLWGHVCYAQDVFRDGLLHPTATHTYTAEGHRWINHENLSEFALAATVEFFGARGLIVGKTLLGLLVVCLMIRNASRQAVPISITCICTVLAAITLTAFWPVRPQLASYVGLALVAFVLDAAFRDWSTRREFKRSVLLWLPLIMFVWTNSHGGFVAGLCLLSAYLGIRAIELLWRDLTVQQDASNPTARERISWAAIGWLSLIGMACWGFSLVNPYGFELHQWMFASLGQPRPEISEWAPPRWGDEFLPPFIVLSVLTWGSVLFTKLRRDPAQLALLALCFWQATSHSRHIALFAILAGFWSPVHVASALSRLKSASTESAEESASAKQGGKRENQSIAGAFGIALTLALFMLCFRLYTRVSDFPVERSEYPVAALQFMDDEQLTGNLVVSFNWAQYALAALAPDVKVQFDGRFRTCYPQEVIDMHFDFLLGDVSEGRFRAEESGEVDPTRVLRYKNPNLVLIDRRFAHSVRVMTEQKDFCLLYQDALAQVWGKATIYDDACRPEYVSVDRRRVSESIQQGSITWPAFPRSPGSDNKVEQLSVVAQLSEHSPRP